MKPRRFIMTTAGYTQLVTELEECLKKRPELVRQLDEARAMGDRSENAYYKSARIALSRTDAQIRRLRIQIAHASIVQPPTTGIVGIGSRVVYIRRDAKNTHTIVGTLEANIDAGTISYISPLGQALLNRHVGDIFTFRDQSISILEIH